MISRARPLGFTAGLFLRIDLTAVTLAYDAIDTLSHGSVVARAENSCIDVVLELDVAVSASDGIGSGR
eukprot:CAMPEP_0172538924 /NCGR_PEP_ID=MMETSP1067-20121228/10227_1 /TAXON_ID=265564 ORGANISM="Thalassiosira punctigera, Strain Tpunct2005C2" /NCGR_SAMPLE_ID=MMETSP1067 /ASSEMBLY_ACC=CAM_ASM_000444 /LENGTH=67 /DNA_ID=CAMNT_0013324517 /DNA_START=50 /DNA_END=248 /DNA_ORIENTATION=-